MNIDLSKEIKLNKRMGKLKLIPRAKGGLSFKAVFDKARANGYKYFLYKGKTYNTKKKNESDEYWAKHFIDNASSGNFFNVLTDVGLSGGWKGVKGANVGRYDKGNKVVYKDNNGNYSTSNGATVGLPVTIRYDVYGNPILHNLVTGEEGKPYNSDEGVPEIVGEKYKMPWYKKLAYAKQTVSDLLLNLGLTSSYETDGSGTTYAVVSPALLNMDLGYAFKVPMRFRDKRFHGRTAPFKEVTYGEPYTGQSAKHYHIDNGGKIQEGYEPYYWNGGVGTISRGRTALKLRDQYANAMHRRRSYTYSGFPYRILEGFRAIKDPQSNSFLLDLPNLSSTIFHVTHFSPETLRGGMRVVGEAATSKTPVLFTVTDDLAPMLEKEGFIRIGLIPLMFDNLPVMKTIMVNKAMGNKQLLQQELKDNGIEGVDVDAIINKINQAPDPTYRGLNLLKTDPSTHHTFNIMDLLKLK